MKMELLAVFLLHCFCLYVHSTQTFQEDAGQYTIYCPSSSVQVYVYLVRTNIESRIYTCTDISIPCKNGIGNGTAEFNSTGSYFPFYYKDIVFIRSIIGIKCFYPEINNNYTEELLIVAKPKNVSCDGPALSTDNRSISITCRTAKVYPQANCTFSMQNMVTGTLTNNNVKYSEVVEYYNTTCTWTSPLSNFDVGQYQYNISFFPSKINNNMNYGASLTQTIQFTLPIPHLSDECFNGTNILNGYIKPGTTVNCICFSASITFPPAFIRWINSDGLDVGTSLNSTATSLTISEAMDLKTFNCLHSSYLKNGNVSYYYTAQYAKGPTTCNVEPKNTAQTIWIICNHDEIVNVSIICNVNKSDAKPGMKSIIYINSISLGVLESDVNIPSDNLYITRYEAVLAQAGNYTISCQVQNIIYNDFKTTCTYSKYLQLYAPPETSPILQIKNKQNVEGSIQENEVYMVVCLVLGGVPQVSNVTVSCGNITESTQSGNIFTSPVTFSRHMTGQNCTCTAQHITGCYTKNMSQQQLNILYLSAVKFYTSSATIIDNGTWTMFVCEADGHPIPQISIFKENIVLNESVGGIISVNKSMTCQDTGTFICQAKNSAVDAQNTTGRNITIYVKCPLHFNSSEEYNELYYKPEQLFRKSIIVYGFPEPSSFKVIKAGNTTSNVQVTYTPRNAAYGSVDVKILKLVSSDFGYYTLIIFQNGSPNLVYTFAIVKVLDDAEKTVNVCAAVGGSVGAVVIIAVLVLIILYLKRKKPNFFQAKKKKREQNPTYSELTVSQSQEDRHTYETPIMEASFTLDNKKEENKNSYLNVKEIEIEESTCIQVA